MSPGGFFQLRLHFWHSLTLGNLYLTFLCHSFVKVGVGDPFFQFWTWDICFEPTLVIHFLWDGVLMLLGTCATCMHPFFLLLALVTPTAVGDTYVSLVLGCFLCTFGLVPDCWGPPLSVLELVTPTAVGVTFTC